MSHSLPMTSKASRNNPNVRGHGNHFNHGANCPDLILIITSGRARLTELEYAWIDTGENIREVTLGLQRPALAPHPLTNEFIYQTTLRAPVVIILTYS